MHHFEGTINHRDFCVGLVVVIAFFYAEFRFLHLKPFYITSKTYSIMSYSVARKKVNVKLGPSFTWLAVTPPLLALAAFRSIRYPKKYSGAIPTFLAGFSAVSAYVTDDWEVTKKSVFEITEYDSSGKVIRTYEYEDHL